MTNLAHWQDDIDDALGGDFDGSLSGLCIMSLSFDFTRNGAGSHMGVSNKDANSLGNNQQVNGPSSASSLATKSYSSSNNDSYNENSVNCFKRFKSSPESNGNRYEEEEGKNNDAHTKAARQLLQIKNCLSSITPTSGTSTINYCAPENSSDQTNEPTSVETDPNRLSPQSSAEGSCHRTSALSTIDDSSRSSTIDARSPSPSPSQNSSITSHSRASSRSNSPSEMSMHSGTNKNINNHTGNRINLFVEQAASNRNCTGQTDQRAQSAQDNQQVSLYSVKDNLFNGGTLKESSYTTSVITTTAPMHFKSLHHPFSLKQFPPSPYHQFSNSSLNHDFYDRYMSLDSHQPLQTPLIGIERTQDLLSLKLPPHGPDEADSQRFSKEWSFEEPKLESSNTAVNKHDSGHSIKNKCNSERTDHGQEKGFPFNYKITTSIDNNDRSKDQPEPIDLNMSYNQDDCCDDQDKDSMFNESMKHFNPERVHQAASFDLSAKGNTPNDIANHNSDGGNASNVAHQYHGQESMFGIDPSKQKFQYVLAAPISVATKLNEDTMTYLNQGQAYEIKLENTTDVAEAKKGFMCSIINIGFQERHMQQAENELWQQWSHQHPNEKIFSVDMKLSYNVFGVESDGLNKYEFLWDSSKAAGVFIRINSISTEFTAKKHGGEKGVPFKLSIETFSYNSKTHDSYFISAACCQIKVFKPKGAERKIRSDRDKIFKRAPLEQEKYHKACDHSVFKECSLTSLHPMADGSLCYYRHSHGHFASKQVVSATSAGASSTSISTNQQSSDEMEQCNSSQHDNSPDDQQSEHNQSGHMNNSNDNESNSDEHNSSNHQRDYNSLDTRPSSMPQKIQNDYMTPRLSQGSSQYGKSSFETSENPEMSFGHHSNVDTPYSQSGDIPFNQMYHTNPIRSAPNLSTAQHFNMPYYGHSLPPPPPLPPHVHPPSNYGIGNNGPLSSSTPNSHSFPVPQQQPLAMKGVPSIYRQLGHDKPGSSTQTNQSNTNSFKASNLAISSTSHSNFQSYFANGGGHTDHVNDNHNGDMKESIVNNSTYHHDAYDSAMPHHFNQTITNSQQPARQRSTSMSLTGGHCSSYGTPNRQSDHYSPHNNLFMENQNNQWCPSTNIGSQASSCGSRQNQAPGTSSDDQNYSGGLNYHCNNHNYDSDQASPHKIQNHSNDSSSSCYSRSKQNSSINPFVPHQDNFEASKPNTRIPMITVNSDCTDVASWFIANRFTIYSKTFNNFSGSDLLRLTKNDLIEICGLIDGIRLYNSLHNQPIKPRRILYFCCGNSDVFNPIHLYDVTLDELMRELSNIHQSRFSNNKSIQIEEKCKNASDKSINSGSSSDSRSPMGPMASDTNNEELYSHRYLNNSSIQRRKAHNTEHKDLNRTLPQNRTIDRLLVEGLTSVKVIATEQVVQLLENESLWELTITTENNGQTEACISACRSKRPPK